MENIFITGIRIEKYRNIENLEIELSQNERKHLILTGKNGSGKTSLISLMVDCLDLRYRWHKDNVTFEETTGLHGKTDGNTVNFNKSASIYDVLLFNIPAEHLFRVSESQGITNIKERAKHKSFPRPNEFVFHNMLQTMVTMRIQQLEAKENNDDRLFMQSETWFKALKEVLATIYEGKELDLKYMPQEYNYKLILDGYEFNLDQMADGFSAFFRIVSEIMEKMDYFTEYGCDYTLPGIAFIDEIETHMHISMQKTVLGFLTKMFPNVQFIVTTHSPFIINSLENAVVFDLSKREYLENPNQYSYESVIEGYYDIDMYSNKLKEKFDRYEELAFCERSEGEDKEFSRLRIEFGAIPPANKEIFVAFKDVEARRLTKKNG